MYNTYTKAMMSPWRDDGFKPRCEIKKHADLKFEFSAFFTQFALILSEFGLSNLVRGMEFEHANALDAEFTSK